MARPRLSPKVLTVPQMAEKEKSAHKPEHGKKKKKLHKIITTRAEDGSFGHEHIYHGEDRPVFAGTSQHMEDLHSHMDDHFGGSEEPESGEENAGEAQGE